MADALMKYETIDHFQIDDIMAGKTPRAPQHWDETPPNGGGSAPSSVDDSEGSSTDEIGKAAEQH
jgi:cell division protease FtsH